MALLRFAARDPGAANVLAALAEGWNQTITLDAWTLPRADRLRAALPDRSVVFDDPPDPEVLERAWARTPADALVTGTSHYAPFEPVLWAIAASRGVTSLAVLDQWMNVAPRFAQGRPDYVGALDAAQRDELASLGFPPSRIVEIGHPWLSQLAASPAVASVTADDVRVLFVSEPIRSDVEQGVNEPFGFDEFDAFAVVHAAAVTAAADGQRVSLAVRCHPYEDAEAFGRHVHRLPGASGLEVSIQDRSTPALDAVRRADLVTGVSSMMLLEAMVLGRAVVSVQPGLSREETFVASARGSARTLTDAREAREVLAALMCSGSARDAERARHAPFLRETARDSRGVLLTWLDSIGVGHGRH